MGTKKQLMPEFESEGKEAEHWDTHSPLDLEAEPKAQKLQVRGAKDRPITIRLDSETRQKLNKLADQQGVGPSTMARSILLSAIERGNASPGKGANLNDLAYLLEPSVTSAIKERAGNATKYRTAGDTDNPAFLILDKSQMNKLGELSLKAISTLFESYGVQVIAPEHTKFKEGLHMVTIPSRSKPKYFFVAFGDPDPAQKRPPLEGGCYPHTKGYSYITNSGMRSGDVLLLYCTEQYSGHCQEAPGIGIVTGIDTSGEIENFYYHYLPLDTPVDWQTIKGNVPELTELKGRTNFGRRGNWLREISNTSLQKALSGRQIIWP